jgi:hypothetical protein
MSLGGLQAVLITPDCLHGREFPARVVLTPCPFPLNQGILAPAVHTATRAPLDTGYRSCCIGKPPK